MYGLNKTLTTERLSSGTYIDNLSSQNCRFEPMGYKKSQGKNLNLILADEISFRFFVDPIDVIKTDRVIVGDRTFVVSSVNKYDDVQGKHYEVLSREVASDVHSEVTLLTISGTQSNQDPITGEWTGDRDYSEETITVLMDQVTTGVKATYKRLTDAGRFKKIEWLMTVELDVTVSIDNFVDYDGIRYEVRWIENYAYETLVGLSPQYKGTNVQ